MYFSTLSPQMRLQLKKLECKQLSSICNLEVKYSKCFSLTEQSTSPASKARRLIKFINRNFNLKGSYVTLYKVCVSHLLAYCSIISNFIDRKKVAEVEQLFTRLTPDLSYKVSYEVWELDHLRLRRIKHNIT